MQFFEIPINSAPHDIIDIAFLLREPQPPRHGFKVQIRNAVFLIAGNTLNIHNLVHMRFPPCLVFRVVLQKPRFQMRNNFLHILVQIFLVNLRPLEPVLQPHPLPFDVAHPFYVQNRRLLATWGFGVALHGIRLPVDRVGLLHGYHASCVSRVDLAGGMWYNIHAFRKVGVIRTRV